jgi:hypothetical protein
MDACPDASSPMTGGEGPGLDICAADLFLLETAAAMPPPNSAPAVNTAAWTITALGIRLKKCARAEGRKIVERVQNSKVVSSKRKRTKVKFHSPFGNVFRSRIFFLLSVLAFHLFKKSLKA